MSSATITVTIEKLVYGNLGLARLAGRVVFVNAALPGEEVRAEFKHLQGQIPLYTAREILRPSPHRITPACPHYDRCGGCDLQHCAYPAQISYKQAMVAETFRRIAKLEEMPQIECYSAQPWQYRMRAQLKLLLSGRALGFYRGHSNRVERITSCPVLMPPINALLQNQDQLLSGGIQGHEQIQVVSAGEGATAVWPALPGYSHDPVILKLAHKIFVLNPREFFQQNRFLLSELGGWLREEGELLVDIYGGSGFFSLFLKNTFKQGILVESDQNLVHSARRNFNLNNAPHLKAVRLSAADFLADYSGKTPCLVIIDPPRSGLGPKILQELLRLDPQRLAYISCDPSTQARDLKVLTQQYYLKKLAFFDMYPHTPHIECAALLAQR